MSKGNSAVKVLRTALKRVQKGWTKSHWHFHDGDKNYVCLEGAIYGYCDSKKHLVTNAQRQAINVVREIIRERTGISEIPTFNDDRDTTQEAVMEVIKLGIIRLETGGDDDEELLDEEDFDDLLNFKESNS